MENNRLYTLSIHDSNVRISLNLLYDFDMKTEQTLPTEKITANSEQLAVLKNNFPQCFDKQGKFLVSKLQEILQADGVDLSRESYGLNWLGKSYARVLANEPIRTMLSEDTEHNEQEQNKNSHNLLIQGDNLEVLKHLKGAYSEKVKMIYIDPPYNTGSDGFVYQDDRRFTPEQFAELAGVEIDEAQRVLDFTQSNANSHSAWLTFIYPRLYIAKQLLREDAVILISIDDNEQAQLKLLCDEVFGETSFLGSFVWRRRQTTDNRNQNNISTDHEYILVYSKTDLAKFNGNTINEDKYRNLDNDPRGPWASIDLSGLATASQRPNLHYPLVDPETGMSYAPNPNRGWSKSPTTMNVLIKEKRILFPKNPNGRPREKKFLRDLRSNITGFSTWLNEQSVGYNTNGTREVAEIFGEKIFSFPKPTSLLMALFEQIIESEDIVLDFFAGSGSTAHALLEFNAKKRTNNYFICVQIAEKTSSKSEAYIQGFHDIFHITKERILRSAQGIKVKNSEVELAQGFKVFKTCDNFLSEMKLEQLTLPKPTQVDLNFNELAAQPSNQVNLNFTELLSINEFDESQLQNILTTWKGLDKILLSENLNTVSLGDYLAYSFGHVLYLVNKGFNTDALKDLIQKLDDEHEFQVSKLVILGHHFDSKSQREIDEAMKNYNNKKSIPVDVVVRY